MSSIPAPTVRAYPRLTRIVAVVMSVAIVAGFGVLGALLKQTEAGTTFHTSDQVAMVGFGVLIAAGILLLARPTVYADAERIRVRNIVQSHTLRWELVEAIRFPAGTSWPVLQLHDDETLAVLAIQTVDGERAAEATEGLRALLAASRTPRQAHPTT
ncbi:MAG: PH domain-containing protein [Geodermatophilaceae bacterium]|nr:PH domain-containing protein [Geodermatophilaceae bacterium]